MTDARKKIGAERRRLRSFGLTVGGAFLLLAAFLFWKARPSWLVFAGLGGAGALLGWLLPAALAPVERVWMAGARAMGWVMTRVVLGIVFALLFTPVGVAMRLFGRDPLELRRNKNVSSYWHARRDHDASPQRMERMF